jgi:hypothetical protein
MNIVSAPVLRLSAASNYKKVYHNQMIIIEQHALYRVWTPLNTYAEFLLLYIKKNPWNPKGLSAASGLSFSYAIYPTFSLRSS